jgi:hypothetical protein
LIRRAILIVNCYFDETRRAIGRKLKIPQPLAPPFLAGFFSPHTCDVRIHNELSDGPLEDETLLGWPDLLVLTGLLSSLDRMLHLTAYARSRNPNVIVIAGGHVTRALPGFTKQFFDYSCQGEGEQLIEIIREALGPSYAAEEWQPRFDLTAYIGALSYAETTRSCNFRCSFCIVTAERRKYQTYGLDHIRLQIASAGKRELVTFVDNNFYGNDRHNWLARLEVIREMWRKGYYNSWVASVTSDFFTDGNNIKLMHDAGCAAVFTGIESFSTIWLRRHNKLQNTRSPQLDLIRTCLDAGVVLMYGLILDVVSRSIADLREELDFVISNHDIPLPSYVCIPIPLLGTPLFYDYLDQKRILPLTKVRDLDGATLSMESLDPQEDVVEFVRRLQRMKGYRRRILQHTVNFYRRYRKDFTSKQMSIALSSAALLSAPVLSTGPSRFGERRPSRTHVSTTDFLDPQYRPAFRVDYKFERYFRPTMITGPDGLVAEEIAADVANARRQSGFASIV